MIEKARTRSTRSRLGRRANSRCELVRLSNELEETVDLAVLSGNTATFIDRVAKPQRLQAISAIGVSFPLHASANGKAMLAEPRDAEVRRLVGNRFTPLRLARS